MRGDAEKGDAARIAGVVVPGEVMRAVKVLDEAKGCEGVEEARVAGPVAAITTTAMLAAVLIKYSFFDIAVSPAVGLLGEDFWRSSASGLYTTNEFGGWGEAKSMGLRRRHPIWQ